MENVYTHETPRFSLRELFLMVVIAAMGCGWWRERNVLLFGTGMSEESRRAGAATMERMKQAMEDEGYRWEPSSQAMVKKDLP